MELTNWTILSDKGPDLVLCLDFPGVRGAAGFEELADGVAADTCFMHVRPASGGPLAACVDRWSAEVAATGRPVRAVLGFCAGTALATRLADAVAAAGPPPVVVLFDAMATTGGSLATEFTTVLEPSAKYLTAGELADARDLSEQLAATYPGDVPRVAAALAERYGRLMRAVADRLSLPEFLLKEITDGFTAYLDYLLLAGEGGFDTHAATPLFVTSADREPPVAGARNIGFDVGHDDLLRDPEVHELVTDLLKENIHGDPA